MVIIDEQQHRLDFAVSKVKGLETINFLKKKVTEELRRLFPHGPDVGIEAVGVHYVAVRKFSSPVLFSALTN